MEYMEGLLLEELSLRAMLKFYHFWCPERTLGRYILILIYPHIYKNIKDVLNRLILAVFPMLMPNRGKLHSWLFVKGSIDTNRILISSNVFEKKCYNFCICELYFFKK